MKKLFKEIVKYKEFLSTNIKKEIRGKYKGAWLGIVWSLLNPLLLLTVYSTIFPYIMKVDVENYTMFLVVALIPWSYFASAVSQGSFCIVSNGNILKKVYFPRIILPIANVTSNTIMFLMSCLIVFAFLIFGGIGISIYVLFLPLIIFLQYLLLLGIVFITSAVTVYIRDLEHIISVGLMVLFYGTPVVYTLDKIPGTLRTILSLNPMTHIINAYRDVLYNQVMPDLQALGILAIVIVILLFIGVWVFEKLQKNFAEEF